MSESLYDIRSNLSSDKITSRAKGRKSCSELINSDANGDIIICNEEWKEILMAALDGALKDTDASLKKDKQPDIEVAVLMRRIVKHTVQSTIHIPFKRYEVLIKHSFQVLYNQAFSAQYRDEYKNILCEILAPKISHSLSFDTFYSIYAYLRQVAFANQRTASETINLKLLKQFCKSLFIDESGRHDFLEKLLDWFENILLPLVSDNLASQAGMTSTLADCCTHLLHYHGLNFFNIFIQNSKNILTTVIRQLVTNQIRDSHRDSCLRFLLAYIKLSTSMNMSEMKNNTEIVQITPHNNFPPLSDLDPLNKNLRTLCDVLTADDVLRSLVVYAYNQVRQSRPKNSYVNALGDCKVMCNLRVTAMVVILHQKQCTTESVLHSEINHQYSNDSSSEKSTGNQKIQNNNSNYDNNNSTAQNLSLKRSYEEHSAPTKESKNVPLNHRIGYADIILQKIKNYSVNKSNNTYVSSDIKNESVQSVHIATATLEGLLLLLLRFLFIPLLLLLLLLLLELQLEVEELF